METLGHILYPVLLGLLGLELLVTHTHTHTHTQSLWDAMQLSEVCIASNLITATKKNHLLRQVPRYFWQERQ